MRAGSRVISAIGQSAPMVASDNVKNICARVTVFALVSRMEFRKKYFPEKFKGEGYK
jgi:hypothetical protein